MEKENLITKYFINTIDACAVKHLTNEAVFSQEYFNTLDAVAETLATKVPHELEKVKKLDHLNKKIKNGKKLTFDQKLFAQNEMKLIQFLDLNDLAVAVGRGFYNENGYIKY